MTTPGDTMAALARDLNRIPASLQTQVRSRLARIGAKALERAQHNAAWSTRIPGAITVTPSTTVGRAGFQLRVSSEVPYARAYEGIAGNSSFRHPVYGHDWWVPQNTRPYALPAVLAEQDDARDAIAAAVDDAARSVGFH